MRTLIFARLTFLEAARRKILLAAFLLGVIFLTVYGVGFHFIMADLERSSYGMSLLERREVQGFLFTAGLYVVNFLTVIMTVLTSVDTISGEIQSGTIHTLASKPVHRQEVLLGKWLGFAGMITLYLLLMAGGIGAIVYLRAEYLARNPLLSFGLLWLNALIVLSVSIFGGTFLSTLANGVLVFGLFGIAFIGGWIEQVGSFLPDAVNRQTATNVGIITSLILPTESIWRRVAYEIQSPLIASMGFSPFVARTVPSPLMIVYAIIFMTVIMLLAMRQFNRRDL